MLLAQDRPDAAAEAAARSAAHFRAASAPVDAARADIVQAHGTLRELSQRQRDVAMLIAGGGTNRAIADALHLSEKTVEKHVSRLLDKLGVRSRAQVAALVGAETRRASEPRTDDADPEST